MNKEAIKRFLRDTGRKDFQHLVEGMLLDNTNHLQQTLSHADPENEETNETLLYLVRQRTVLCLMREECESTNPWIVIKGAEIIKEANTALGKRVFTDSILFIDTVARAKLEALVDLLEF